MQLIIKSSKTHREAQLGLDDIYHQESTINFCHRHLKTMLAQ
jgi:hypothetical protein